MSRSSRGWGRRARASILATLVAAVLPTAASAQQNAHGWTSLFDGGTLAGWKGSARHAIEDGTLVLPGGAHATPLCTERQYGDFVLRFRASPSGRDSRALVVLRSTVQPSAGGSSVATAVSAGIGLAQAGTLRSRLDRVIAAGNPGERARIADTTRWLDHAIYVNGGQIRAFVNGILLSDHVAASRALPRSGAICLYPDRDDRDTLRIREIELRELAPRPPGPLAEPSRTVRFRKHVVTRDFVSEGVAAADVDRDGDVDLIAGAHWFEAPSWRRHELRAPKAFSIHRGYSDSFLNFALDVDRDGWVDAIQFDFPGRAAYWYRNPGSAGGAWTQRVVHPAVASESPHMVDVNGDGRDDLLFVDARTREVVWMEAPTQAGDTTWTRHPVSDPLSALRSRIMPHGLGFADMDGDGQRDVIALDAWWRARALPGASWEEHHADLGGPAAQMYAYDVDGDGDRDVISSSAHDYGLWWHEHSPTEKGFDRWIHHTIDARVSVMHALAAADLDGDGILDLVSGKRFLAHNGNDPGEYDPSVLLWYRGGRDAARRPTWTPQLIDGDTGIGLQIVLADVTGDGRADIVSSSKKGVYVFERVP